MENSLKKGTDFIGVSIVYFCHDGHGKFVMAKRSANARDEQGRWDIGGGGLEFGDTVEDTLRKEIMEEYCTEVVSFEFLGYRDAHREHNGKPTHWVSLDFKVLVKPEMVKIGEPHKFDDISWFTLDALPENVHSQLVHFFEPYKEKLAAS
jgi:8-oxo-dGTP diphosphatase